MKKAILILAIAHITIVSYLSKPAARSDKDHLRPASGNTADSNYIARIEMQHQIRTMDQPVCASNNIPFNTVSGKNRMQPGPKDIKFNKY